MRGLVFGVAACLTMFGCRSAKPTHADDAGASHVAAADAASAAASADDGGKPKALDATACDPGKSLDPVDKGKTIETDHFRFTLLDVRADTIDNAFAPVKQVYLVKLAVENLTNKPNLNLSITDVDLTRDKPGADRLKDKNLHYKIDFFYPRPKMCVDLAADVKPGMIPPGTRVVGYFAFQAPETPAYKSLWFDARHVSTEAVHKGTLLKVAGVLRVR